MLISKANRRTGSERTDVANLHSIFSDNRFPGKRQKPATDVIEATLDELETLVDRLDTMAQNLTQAIDACIEGQDDIKVSSAVCLVRLNLDVRGLMERISQLSQNTRERYAKADEITKRLEILRDLC